MKLRADVKYEELFKYGFSIHRFFYDGRDDMEFISYTFWSDTLNSYIEVVPFDVNGNEIRAIRLVTFEKDNDVIDDDVLDKLYELIVAGLIEAPKPVLPDPKPIEIDKETLDEFWTMMRNVFEKSLETCGLVVKLVTNDEKETQTNESN